MQSGVLGELGVKGDTQHGVLSNAYDPPLAGGNRLHSRPEFFHPRRSDEDSREDTNAFLPGQAKLHGGFEAMHLAPEGVAAHRYVQGSKEWLLPFGGTGGQHDETGASPQDRVVGHEGAQAGAKPTGFHKLAYGRAFSPGDDEPVKTSQICRQAHLHRLGAQTLKHVDVFSKGALQGKDTDL